MNLVVFCIISSGSLPSIKDQSWTVLSEKATNLLPGSELCMGECWVCIVNVITSHVHTVQWWGTRTWLLWPLKRLWTRWVPGLRWMNPGPGRVSMINLLTDKTSKYTRSHVRLACSVKFQSFVQVLDNMVRTMSEGLRTSQVVTLYL